MDVTHKWRRLGLALGLKPALLNTIEADNASVESRLDRILTKWLNRSYDTRRFGEPSWELLVAAVAHPAGGSDCALAKKITEENLHQ